MRIKLVTLVICLQFWMAISAAGQTTYPMDGHKLKLAIEAEKIDSTKIRLFQQLRKYYAGQYLISQNKYYLDSAIRAINEAINISKKIHNDSLKYQSIKYLGLSYIQSGDTTNAQKCQKQTEKYFLDSRYFNLAIKSWIGFGEAADRKGVHNLGMDSYQRSLALFYKHPTAGNEAVIRYHIAQEYFLLNNPARGEKEALAIVAKFNNKNINLDQAKVFLAVYYQSIGDYKRALKYCLASVKDVEKFREISEPDFYYGELAVLYDALGESEKCIFYYKKTLELRNKTAIEEEFLFRTSGFIIKNYIKLGKTDAAINELIKTQKQHKPQSPLGKVFNMQNQAYCDDASGKVDIAERRYLQVIADLKSLQYNAVIGLAYEDLSNFYLSHNRLSDARISAENIGASSDLFEMKRFELLRFKIDSANNDAHGALEHFMKYTRFRDSISNESKSRDIAELQLQYETDKKESNIKLLTKNGRLQKEQLEQANINQKFILGGSGVLLILLGLLYNSYRINQRNANEIDKKNTSLNLIVFEKDELLKEKEWLIKEIHHRVKNNLQIVMGLLQRQSSFISNKDALSAIRNSEQRMNSVALIHQKLYQSENVMTVNMSDYIDEMVGYLQDCFDLRGQIKFEKEVDLIELEVNIAVPVGLILNEAVTNSIKYAFQTDEMGLIRIALKCISPNCYSLMVCDNGRGLPSNFDLQKTNSMGFNLMRGLSKQIGGKLIVASNNGLEIEINFKLQS
ncbi:MAG: sensor histidine kinase [Mucilaginibacter sp.]|uniref:tetratricopeptide repeat-containing sensor histidine kinase n=1 Tax=Mucilaginibacter sp. TaxID=1882438 RepID=UPI003562EA00